MRSSIFKTVLLGVSALAAVCTAAGANFGTDSLPDAGRHEQVAVIYRGGRLAPRYTKMQYAGGMGMLSLGVGWDYGRQDQWETELFVGFVPKFSHGRATMTFTVKQNYIPWKIPVGKQFWIEPLETGLYVSAVTSKNFWFREPTKYGGPYYRFPTSIRGNIFLGQRFTFGNWERRPHQSVSIYYEVSSNDLYLMGAFTNSTLRPRDYLVLSVGAKFQFGSRKR